MSSEQPAATGNKQSGPRPNWGRGPSRLIPAIGSELTAQVLRRLERKTRHYRRSYSKLSLPGDWLTRVTSASFRLEHFSVTDMDVIAAVARRNGARGFRSAQVLRVRNHVAILRAIERMTRARQDLSLRAVMRWYTSISCGLSIGSVDAPRVDRLAGQIRRVNATPMRVQQALSEAAGLYVELIGDPVFPGFNGILARLLLEHQLMRCGLPPVSLGEQDGKEGMASGWFMGRLLERVVEACEALG